MGGGNPIKRATKAVKKAVGQVSAEASRAGDNLTKAATAGIGAVTDPGVWLGYAINPTVGLGMGADKAKETWDLMSEEERLAAEAEAQKKMALAEEEKARKAQEKMVADKAKEEARVAKERAARLGQGRRGLLYQATGEMGVGPSKTLGG